MTLEKHLTLLKWCASPQAILYIPALFRCRQNIKKLFISEESPLGLQETDLQ